MCADGNQDQVCSGGGQGKQRPRGAAGGRRGWAGAAEPRQLHDFKFEEQYRTYQIIVKLNAVLTALRVLPILF